MNIVKATHNFERWLGEHIELIPADLRLKHESMAESPFNFFRATFYRWMQLWPKIGPDLAKAPRVLAVGDLHVENFGTWRDIEGRLIWGINDFDEAAILPYTLDLVRLASSAMLAIKEGHLSAKIEDICAAIMDGYRESLAVGGRPYVLEEQNSWLREIALNELRDPVHFWKRIDMLPKFKGSIPKEARKALDRAMPEPKLPYELRKRVAGLGSLGHVRAVALADWVGGRIARETKSLAPSAVYWAQNREAGGKILYEEIVNAAVRCPDPFLRLRGNWLIRRLSPHCSRIELSMLPKQRGELRLLNAMGRETANIHLGSRNARKSIRRHVGGMKSSLLLEAAKGMGKVIIDDWKDWKKGSAR